MNPSGCALAVDVGGTRTKIGVVDAVGTVLVQENILAAYYNDLPLYFEDLRSILKRLAESYHPVGIGLSLPGFLSEDRQVIRYNPNTQPLVGVDIYSELCGLGLPLRFEQDLNTHALAEYHFGERCGTRRLMTVAIGAGLGAAVTLEGELVRLAGGTAGDTGHIILLPDGPECTAGCKGCAEALVSSPAVEREYALAASDPRAAHLNSQIAAGVPTARAVIRAARESDPVAVEVFQRIGNWLGQWLASLAAIFLPEVIILCGGVSEAGEPLRSSADLRMRQLAGPEYTSGCEVITGKFRGQAGMVGAAVPLLKSLTEGERSKSK